MIKHITFSPTGGTRKVADAISSGISGEVERIELCVPVSEITRTNLSKDDLAIIAAPVYGGRIPALAIERLKSMVKANDGSEKGGKPWYQTIPRFIIWFVVAILVNTYLLSNASLIGESAANIGSAISGAVNQLAKHIITLSLFFIGAGLTRKTLKAVGIRPLIQGILLWIIISCVSLAYILWIS